jgi:membrane protein DedA with SNARE-associated domain
MGWAMLHGWALEAVTFVTSTARANPHWAFPIAFVTAFAESFVGFSIVVPGFAILVALGSVIGASHIGVLPAILGAAGGAICGNWISWWLGLHYHHQLLHLWPFRKFEAQIEKALHFFHRWGAWGVFFGQFLGPFRATVPLVAGMSELEFRPFIIASVSAAILWATFLLTFPAAAMGMF